MSSDSDTSSSSSSSSSRVRRERRRRKKEKKRARPDRPSDADLEELLAKKGYKCFSKLSDSRAQVKCSICNKELKRAFASDLDAHLATSRHKTAESARAGSQKITDLLDRPSGMAEASPAQLHQYYTVIHLLKCNVALSTVGDLLTDKFIEALKSQPRVGGRQLLNQLAASVKLIEAGIRSDIKDKFLSLLADETPCRNGAGFVCIMAATADKLHVLRAVKFDLERTLNAEGLKAELLAVVQQYNLDQSRLVSLVLDNVSYGEAAFDSLQSEPGYNRLIKIGCIAHILNLMSTAYTHRAFFPSTNALLEQLRKVLCTKHGKLDRGLRKEFAARLGRSTSVLDFVDTRWSEWLDTLHWVHDHAAQLAAWLASEADRLHALVLPSRKDMNKCAALEQQLRDLHRMLRAAETRAEMAVLDEPTRLLSEFILLAQRSDPIAFARHAQRLEDWVTMLGVYAQPEHEPELRTQVTRALGHDLVLAPALVNNLTESTRAASLACKEKFDKHSGTTMAVLHALALFDRNHWQRNRVPEALPEAVLGPFIPPQDLISTRLNWLAVRRCPLFQDISTTPPAQGARAAEDAPPQTSLKIWRDICDNVSAVHLRNLIDRLFSVRQGIADVERAFSRLRAIDSANRALANPATQEAEFFLSVNAPNFDAYAQQ